MAKKMQQEMETVFIYRFYGDCGASEFPLNFPYDTHTTPIYPYIPFLKVSQFPPYIPL